MGERGLGVGLDWVHGDYMRDRVPSRGFTELCQNETEGWVDSLSQLKSTSSVRVGC